MKIPSLVLKSILPFILTIFLFALGTTDGFGQKINKNIANQEARANRAEAGFQRINFTKNNLSEVLNGATAIKFYNGLPNGTNTDAVLMAIGVDENGNEIGDIFQQTNSEGLSVAISSAVKDLQAKNAARSRKVTAFSTSFGAQDIMDMLNVNGVDGIDFLPSKKQDSSGNQVLTLTASPTGSSAEAQEMQSLRSPCPPECFN